MTVGWYMNDDKNCPAHPLVGKPTKSDDDARLDELIAKPILAPYERSELRWLIVALRQRATWIPIEQRSPKTEGDYLVFPGPFSDPIAIERWSSEHKCFLMEIEDGKRVTHWMDVPTPPE